MEFIRQIAPMAQESQRNTGIYASLIIAQAALESGWGTSVPRDARTGKCSYNLFGIKGDGPAGWVEWTDHDLVQGKLKPGVYRFRAYHSYAESIADHGRLLSTPRYDKVRQAGTVEEAVRELYAAGYAVDPEYPDKLLSIIQKYRLTGYDLEDD